MPRTVPQRLRFDVFKRDKFTCQYCGHQAPDVVLNCDHIRPLADGGETDLLNLITSCRECNGGKGARLLTRNEELDRQRSTLADLEERRQQIEMMLQWRDELRDTMVSVVDEIGARIAARAAGYGPNENGKATLQRWLRRFTVAEILAAIDESFDVYLRWAGDEVVADSWELAFAKIASFAYAARQAKEKPYMPRLLYIQGIIRKRIRSRKFSCADYLEHLHLCGAELDRLENHAKSIGTFDEFDEVWDAWLESIGRPY